MQERITVVFVPLQEEMKGIYEHIVDSGLGTCKRRYDASVREYVFSYFTPSRRANRVIFSVIDGMGNLNTAAHVADAVAMYSPHNCILIGIAGSLNPATYKLGDVVISTTVKNFAPDKLKTIDPGKEVFANDAGEAEVRITIDERKRIFEESFLRYRRNYVEWERSTRHTYDYIEYLDHTQIKLELSGVGEDVSGLPDRINPQPSVHEGTILGSDFVIDSAEFVAFLQERNKDETQDYYLKKSPEEFSKRRKWFNSDIAVVDMESLGFFTIGKSLTRLAAANMLSIRGVSDYSSQKGALDTASQDGVRRIAVRNAAMVTLDFLNYLDSIEKF